MPATTMITFVSCAIVSDFVLWYAQASPHQQPPPPEARAIQGRDVRRLLLEVELAVRGFVGAALDASDQKNQAKTASKPL